MLKATLLGLASAIIVGLPFVVQQPANAEYWRNNNWNGHGWSGNRGWYGSNMGYGIDRREQQFLNQLQRGQNSGRLTASEVQQLRNRYNRLESLEAQYRSGGLNPWERQRLQQKMNNLNSFLQQELHDNQYAGRWNSWNGWY